MKKTIILILFFLSSISELSSQNYDISNDELFSGGNVIIKKLMKRDYSEAEGSPYLKKDFVKGKIIFNNGKEYDIYARLNVAIQKFEIKKILSSQETLIDIDETVKVLMDQKEYSLHSVNTDNENILAILEECIVLKNVSLYFFPRKVIKMPVETGAVAPSTGFTKVPKPRLVDASEYLIYKNKKWYTIPNSFKKLVEKNIFDSKLLKKYKKSNKLNLKKKESLINLVSYFNSI
jgi:hypothetical protein